MLFLHIQILIFVAGFLAGPVSALPTNTALAPINAHHDDGKNLTAANVRGYDIPIRRRRVERSGLGRRGTLSGQAGLGNNADL